MESIIKLPVDLEQLPPFRQLCHALGNASKALHVWFSIWKELFYRMQEGAAPGRILRAEGDGFIDRTLMGLRLDTAAVLPEVRQQVLEAMFKPDGEDLVCLRFIALHGGVSLAPRSMAQRGGDMRAFNMRMKSQATAEAAFQQALNISEHKFVDEAGAPLEAELTRRVTRLIIACDNALFRPMRQAFGYTEGLIQSALRVARRHSDEEIDLICRSVAGHRGHPALNGMNTEKLLEVFSDIAGALEQG